jgi:hypothetical protein
MGERGAREGTTGKGQKDFASELLSLSSRYLAC